MQPSQRLVQAITRRLIPEHELARLHEVAHRDAGQGFDEFGMHPDGVVLAAALLRVPYRRYFRVESSGAEHLPATGPGIVVANHSGMLPVDAAMLYADVLGFTDPPRVLRAVADHFVLRLPWFSTLVARAGVIGGARESCARLLERGELLLIFPEGAPGIGKPRAQRYHLAEWRVGHAELAIRHHAPVIPAAVIGAEEQWPELFKLRGLHPFGAPYLPIPMTPLPLPVRYHILYGEPIELGQRYAAEDADRPAVVAAAAAEVRVAVEALIKQGLAARKGLFA